MSRPRAFLIAEEEGELGDEQRRACSIVLESQFLEFHANPGFMLWNLV